MELEKTRKEIVIDLERTEVEMQKRLHQLRAESEIAELKSKWFFLAKSKGYYHVDLSKFSEWLNEVAYVHDEMTVQFRSQSEKKGYSNTEKVKTSTIAVNEQNKSTSPSTRQCLLKDGGQIIWMCTKFKQQGVNERYETLKNYDL